MTPRSSQAGFNQYYRALKTDTNFPGMRGIGFLRLMRTGNEAEVERDIQRRTALSRRIYPETDQPWRAPLMMFEPLDPGNLDALGYRHVHRPAAARGVGSGAQVDPSRRRPVVSSLGQATGNAQTYPGFLAFCRIDVMAAGQTGGAATAGFLYAAFRAGDLFNTALGKSPLLPVNVEVYDSVVDPDNLLFRSEAPPNETLGDALMVTRQAARRRQDRGRSSSGRPRRSRRQPRNRSST